MLLTNPADALHRIARGSTRAASAASRPMGLPHAEQGHLPVGTNRLTRARHRREIIRRKRATAGSLGEARRLVPRVEGERGAAGREGRPLHLAHPQMPSKKKWRELPQRSPHLQVQTRPRGLPRGSSGNSSQGRVDLQTRSANKGSKWRPRMKSPSAVRISSTSGTWTPYEPNYCATEKPGDVWPSTWLRRAVRLVGPGTDRYAPDFDRPGSRKVCLNILEEHAVQTESPNEPSLWPNGQPRSCTRWCPSKIRQRVTYGATSSAARR
jgi:hypothetical protein